MAFTILAIVAVTLTGLALLLIGLRSEPRRLPVRIDNRALRRPHGAPRLPPR